MATFGNFVLAVSRAGIDGVFPGAEKTSSVLGQLPDSEFGLVVRDGSQRLAVLPIHDEDSVAMSAAHVIAGDDVLSPGLRKMASLRIISRMQEMGEEAPRELQLIASSSAEVPRITEWAAMVDSEEPVEKTSSAPDLPQLFEVEVPFVGGEDFTMRTMSDLRDAEAYINTWHDKMSSTDLRSFRKAISEAYSQMDIPEDRSAMNSFAREKSSMYLGTDPRANAEAHIQARIDAVPAPKASSALRGIVDDMAAEFRNAYDCDDLQQRTERLEKLAADLDTFDRTLGLDDMLPGVLSVFYAPGEGDFLKRSAGADPAKMKEDPKHEFGHIIIRESDIKHLASRGVASRLEQVLPEEVVDALVDDPLTIFKSLPLPQKKVVAEFVHEFVTVRRPLEDVEESLYT
jgi:hypothetical protein